MTTEPVKPVRQPRRWLRWMGRLLVLMALCGGMLFRAYWVNQRSDAAVARLREVADVFNVDSTHFPFARFVPARFQSLLPQRLNPFLVAFRSGTRNPGKYLLEIPTRGLYELVFCESDLTPEDLSLIHRFPNLQCLTMIHCQLAEGTLSDLKNSPHLKYLEVRKCQFSSRESIDYARLPNLHFLFLKGPSAGDSHLRGLAEHPCLNEIYLEETAITDEGLRNIRRLPSLQRLHVGKTQVTGIGLAELDSPVTQLNLVGTLADDQAMTVITRLSSLEFLDLAQTKVTVVGVRHLQQMPQLRDLVVDHCDIGDEALEPLSAFPQSIRWSAIGTRMTRQQTSDAPQRPL